ncbi:MAG: 4-hydroxy-tetrahydrodipicolinate synthase [Actinobacteria bacterium]|nr:4-hydroxy-tetrahydrodipicolinate synthase [Actinomycetota bacterium]
MARFGRVLTAMVTPFDDAGRLDTRVAENLARWLVANGSDGIVLAGSTGEGSVLTDDEDVQLVEAVREAVDCPIIVGATTNDTAHSVELIGRIEPLGVDGILAVCPYYNRPSQSGIEAHFRAVAEATHLPVMIYDIPVRSGRKIATSTILALAEVDNIVALKDAAGNPAESANLIAAAPEGFEVYSGDDSLTLPLLAVGAVGVVGVATHWQGAVMSAMISAFDGGDVDEARRLNGAMLPSFEFETGDDAPNPLPAKALMRRLGFAVGQCRPPMGEASPELDARAVALAAELNLEPIA